MTYAEMRILFTGDDKGFREANSRVQKGLAGTSEAAARADEWLSSVAATVAKLGNALTGQAEKAEAFALGLKNLGKSAAALDKALNASRVIEYSEALGRLDGVGSALSVEFAELTETARTLNRALANTNATGYGDRMTGTAGGVSALGERATLAEEQVRALNAELARTRALSFRWPSALPAGGGGRGAGAGGGMSLSGAGSALTQIGGALTRNVTVPIVAAGIAAEVVGIKFEAAMAKVGALAGASQQEVKSWSDQILKMSENVGQTPQALADGLYRIASEGIHGAKAMDVLEVAAKMSSAGLGEMKDTGYGLAVVLNDFAGSGITAAQAADVFVRAVKTGNVATEDLVKSFGRVLPIASSMGVPFSQAAAAMAQLTREGYTAAQASTAVARLLFSFAKPSKGAKDAMDAAGLSASGVAKQMRTDLLGALEHVTDAAKKHHVALSAILPLSVSYKAAIGILGSSAKESRQAFDDVAKSTYGLGDAFNKVADTDAFKIKQAVAELAVAGVSLKRALGPIVKDLAGDVKYLAEQFEHLDPSTKKAVVGVLLVAAAAGPALTTLGLLVKTAALLRSGFLLLEPAAAAAARAQAIAGGGALTLNSSLTTAIGSVWGLRSALLGLAGLSAVATGVGLLWQKGLNNMAEGNNHLSESMDRLNRMPINSFSHSGELVDKVTSHSFLGIPYDTHEFSQTSSQGFLERRRSQEEMSARKDLRNYDPKTGVFHMPKQESEASIRADFNRQIARVHAIQEKRRLQQEAAELIAQQEHAKKLLKLAGMDPDANGGDDGTGKPGKMSDAQKEAEQHQNSYKDSIQALTIALREVGVTEEWRKAIIARNYGEYKGYTEAEWQKTYALISQKERLENAAAAQKAYSDEIKAFRAEVTKAQTAVLIAKSTSDEDAIALEKYGKAFAKLTDPKHIALVSAFAKAAKDLKAAQYDFSGAVFDNGSDAASKELEARNKGAASVDPAAVEFDDGSTKAAEYKKKQLETFASAIRSLVKEYASLTKQTDDARLTELQFDEAGRRMSKDQAEKVLALQKYVEKLKEFNAEMAKYAEQGANLVSGGVERIFQTGFRGLSNSLRQELKKTIQGDIVGEIQSRLKGAFEGLLKKGQPKKPAGLDVAIPQNTSAVVANTQALIALCQAMGGDVSGLGTGSQPLSFASGATGQIKGGSLISGALSLASLLPVSKSFSFGGVTGGIQGYASGGYFDGSKPIMVGEQGREVIMPVGNAGRVIPNGQLGGETHYHSHNHSYDIDMNYNMKDASGFNQRTGIQQGRDVLRALDQAHRSR